MDEPGAVVLQHVLDRSIDGRRIDAVFAHAPGSGKIAVSNDDAPAIEAHEPEAAAAEAGALLFGVETGERPNERRGDAAESSCPSPARRSAADDVSHSGSA
jgi:hypothetical protein